MKKMVCMLVGISLLIVLCGCDNSKQKTQTNEEVAIGVSNEELVKKYDATGIELSDEKIMVDRKEISSDSEASVYAAKDIVFYQEGQDFTYGEGTKEDEHSQEEADAHTVVHITKPGKYVISGKMSAGQIAVDLGKDADEELDAVVTLILNNADITCSVAPGIIFYNVYECCDDDEEDAKKDVDTSAAGANVIIADDSINTVNGSYVAKIYKSVELNEAGDEVVDSKKLHKYDAAFYSKRSMNIEGEESGNGILNIYAENEGLGSELNLTINGGTINIDSGNDGINTNEDGVSVTTINGGNLNIVVNGSTGEGDGIDSNGWLVINGGTVTSFACGDSMDAGIDSDKGIHMNGGTVIATGNMLDEIAESEQNYAVFNFYESVSGGSAIMIKNNAGEVVSEYAPDNDFTCLVVSAKDLTEGTYTIWKDGMQMAVSQSNGSMHGMPGGGRGPKPEDGKIPQGERPERPEGAPQIGTEYVIPDGNPMMKPEGNWEDLEEPPQKPEGDMPKEDFENNIMKNTEEATVFHITEGGNMFVVMKSDK